MSLKQVHLAFVTAATLLALFVALQAFAAYRVEHSSAAGVATFAALAGAALLIRVEAAFLRRCRREGVR